MELSVVDEGQTVLSRDLLDPLPPSLASTVEAATSEDILCVCGARVYKGVT
jgi:hypothetical protein